MEEKTDDPKLAKVRRRLTLFDIENEMSNPH
jgi:hypothetical protein